MKKRALPFILLASAMLSLAACENKNNTSVEEFNVTMPEETATESNNDVPEEEVMLPVSTNEALPEGEITTEPENQEVPPLETEPPTEDPATEEPAGNETPKEEETRKPNGLLDGRENDGLLIIDAGFLRLPDGWTLLKEKSDETYAIAIGTNEGSFRDNISITAESVKDQGISSPRNYMDRVRPYYQGGANYSQGYTYENITDTGNLSVEKEDFGGFQAEGWTYKITNADGISVYGVQVFVYDHTTETIITITGTTTDLDPLSKFVDTFKTFKTKTK